MPEAPRLPDPMTLEEFLLWDAPDDVRWQRVNGEPVALANPGVRLGIRADSNFRIPDIGVTCSPLIPGDAFMPDPILLVE